MAKVIIENMLFYGGNLDILRDYLIDECVHLVYFDPPFNSSRNYNMQGFSVVTKEVKKSQLCRIQKSKALHG